MDQVFFYKQRLFFYNEVGYNLRTLRCLGWSAKPIQDMLEELLQSYNVERSQTLTEVSYPFEGKAKWAWPIEVVARSMKSVLMDDQDKGSLIADVEWFLKGRQWYEDREIPWRRGYLFYGPPGTGKSSVVMGLASYFALSVRSIQFHPQLTDNGLLTLLRQIPDQNSIILFEDVDSSGMGNRKGQNGKSPSQVALKNTKVTLSGLLNALDGLFAPRGAIFVMTTNYPDRLDPALTRPGRIDYQLKFDLASQEQARRMFLHLCGVSKLVTDLSPEEIEEAASTFASRIPDKKISPAALQDYLLRYRATPLEAVDAVTKLVESEENREEMKQMKHKRHKKQKKETKQKSKADLGRKSGDGEKPDSGTADDSSCETDSSMASQMDQDEQQTTDESISGDQDSDDDECS